MIVAVDTNVLSALLNDEPNADKISRLLAYYSQRGKLVICSIVYSELLVLYPYEDLKHFLEKTGIRVDSAFSEKTLRAAAEAWGNYLENRRNKIQQYTCPKCGHVNIFNCARCGAQITGPKTLLADFLIGAHALHSANSLFTLDRGRVYEKYFPSLKIICL